LYRPASQTTSRCVPDLPYTAIIGGAAVLAPGAAEAATRAVLKAAPVHANTAESDPRTV